MAYEMPDFEVGIFPADIDMSALVGQNYTYQFRGMCVYTALSTTGVGGGGAAVIPPSATSSPIVGVLQNNPLQGEAAALVVSGISKGQAAGSFSIGDLLMTNSAGQFLKATSTNYQVAQALEQAVSGDICAILLIRNGKA